jgi:hypothetical protein
MLSEPIQLNKIAATEIIEFLYGIFHRDFVANKTYLANTVYINPRSHRKDKGKELDFWHLTSREQTEVVWENKRRITKVIGRYPDFARASRLEWVKQILTQHDHPSIKVFYHRETNKNRDIRLYLWAYEHDFVVILQKLGKSDSFLVTSFYVDHDGKKMDYQARYLNYRNGDKDLQNCEWF